MTHSHSEHDHDHHSHLPQDRNTLRWSFAIITVFMLIEFVGGYFFNSLALIADAGHMANDSLSLGLAVLDCGLLTRLYQNGWLCSTADRYLLSHCVLFGKPLKDCNLRKPSQRCQ